MSAVIDMFMTNHKLSSYSSTEEPDTYNSILIKQKGGDPSNNSDVLKNVATGSFPPIYFISQEEREQKEKDKSRTFAAPIKKTAVSIKEIMQERRDDKKPFITF